MNIEKQYDQKTQRELCLKAARMGARAAEIYYYSECLILANNPFENIPIIKQSYDMGFQFTYEELVKEKVK